MALGIKASGHLMTFHPAGRNRRFRGRENWLDFNTTQSGHRANGTT